MKRLILIFFLAALLLGCTPEQAPSPEETAAPTAIPETTTVPETTISIAAELPLAAEAPTPSPGIILQPEAPGEAETRCSEAVIDYSHCEEGYIMAQYFGETDKRLKILVKGPTTTYSYNLPLGEWTVFPLSDGNGIYQVGLYRNTTGTKYAKLMVAEFEVALQDEFAPFLRPNQYVNYVDAPDTMEMGETLCAGLEHPLDKVAAVYDFVVDHLSYDHEKAAQVQSGYLPVLDQVLSEGKGICFDYAALMAAMLRSQQVPCKLVVGYAGSVYHAWISVWTEENGWIDGVVFFDGHSWKRMDPTFASSGNRSQDIMDFIEHGTYTAKYLY